MDHELEFALACEHALDYGITPDELRDLLEQAVTDFERAQEREKNAEPRQLKKKR
jgi:hypothetical protein